MDMSTVKELRIKEGPVMKITDSSGNILWKCNDIEYYINNTGWDSATDSYSGHIVECPKPIKKIKFNCIIAHTAISQTGTNKIGLIYIADETGRLVESSQITADTVTATNVVGNYENATFPITILWDFVKYRSSGGYNYSSNIQLDIRIDSSTQLPYLDFNVGKNTTNSVPTCTLSNVELTIYY